eukprot:CAMPEP_0180231538 /NCGR_PEP_ID=MMETSP0987-20121128/26892_1 /TAXON_ID=697907 /ORGANISM="non described non described, Strain CCMP2293" /LENGTH=167 /DNA_ID=CAMNT_0022196889 /DNA_START=1 /DNA_END=500 /DNA_ORIENTATION=+
MYDNPYHNWTHVFDVTQTTYAFARRAGTLARISEWDRFALLAAALCHDLEHPGVSSPFIAKAGAVFSGAFKDVLLEKHHALRAFEVMVDRDVGLLEGLSTAQYYNFRKTVTDCILATDMTKHAIYLGHLNEAIAGRGAATKEGLPAPEVDTQLEMEFMIKCADISNV